MTNISHQYIKKAHDKYFSLISIKNKGKIFIIDIYKGGEKK